MNIADEPVPIHALQEIYPDELQSFQRARFDRLSSMFEQKFSKKPDLFVRSPGRVNLIGEHVDYSGFSVLPMALDRDFVMAVSRKNADDLSDHSNFIKTNIAMIQLASTQPEKYNDYIFSHDPNVPIEVDSTVHFWANYFLGPYKAVVEHFNVTDPVSFCVMVDGNVPASSGVSSSSAFACTAVLCTAFINELKSNKGVLANLANVGENYTGVQGGGMDQSISLMGVPNSALLIHFHPKLNAECIPIPKVDISIDPFVFVVANTLVVADKHVTAPRNYNLRVAETRLAAALLAKYLKQEELATGKMNTLRTVMDKEIYQRRMNGLLRIDEMENRVAQFQIMLDIVETCFSKEIYSKETCAAKLGLSTEEMRKKYMNNMVIECDGFELYKRAKHVYAEAGRVFQFIDLSQGILSSQNEDLLNALGQVMNASQASCRDLFDCSCPELDLLTSLSLEAGAHGSRLTGAGWGGCTVSLVKESNVSQFIQKLKTSYYDKCDSYNPKYLPFDQVVFYCKPGLGGSVVKWISQ